MIEEVDKRRPDIRGAGIGTVFKFGGTSVGSVERIEHVAALCARLRPAAVVVSAMSGETDRLIQLSGLISPRVDVPEYDLLITSGEHVTVALLCAALRKRGIEPRPLLGFQAGLRTDSLFSRARIAGIDRARLLMPIARGQLPVIAGFQGITSDGQITSLGRGGSDTTAVAVAAGLGIRECVIYTDVDGVYSADPRLCPRARLLRRVHPSEMLEMASQGSKVLHLRSVHLAAKCGVRLRVRNTFNQSEGTMVTAHRSDLAGMEGEVVTGISTSREVALVRVLHPRPHREVLPEVLAALAERGIAVDCIQQLGGPTGHVISFSVSATDLDWTLSLLRERFPEATVEPRGEIAKVTLVGLGLMANPAVNVRGLRLLTSRGIDVFAVSTAEIKISYLIPRAAMEDAVTALHKELIEAAPAS
jgi:aspartate kinase